MFPKRASLKLQAFSFESSDDVVWGTQAKE